MKQISDDIILGNYINAIENYIKQNLSGEQNIFVNFNIEEHKSFEILYQQYLELIKNLESDKVKIPNSKKLNLILIEDPIIKYVKIKKRSFDIKYQQPTTYINKYIQNIEDSAEKEQYFSYLSKILKYINQNPNVELFINNTYSKTERVFFNSHYQSQKINNISTKILLRGTPDWIFDNEVEVAKYKPVVYKEKDGREYIYEIVFKMDLNSSLTIYCKSYDENEISKRKEIENKDLALLNKYFEK